MLRPRILIVEDDAVIRRLLVTALSHDSLDIHTAEDGLEATEKIRASRYAVVLVDLMMPRMSGFELLGGGRELFRDPRPVIFVMTAFDATEHRLDPTLVDAIFRKPFDVLTVAEIVRECAVGWRRWVTDVRPDEAEPRAEA